MSQETWANPAETELPNWDKHLIPFNYRIVVMPIAPPKKIGSIIIADSVSDNHEWMNTTGRIVAMGAGAYKHPKYANLGLTEKDLPKTGDWVIYTPYQPFRFRYKDTRLIVIADEHIVGIIPEGANPWDIRAV